MNTSKVMLALGTKPEYFNAVWVKNEWSRFLKIMKKDRSRLLIPCYRDMDPYELPEEFAHLQAQDMGKIGFINDLVRGIKKVIVKEAAQAKDTEKIVVAQTSAIAQVKRGNMALEDCEWEKADDFFEQALNYDPECAEAYLGKLLAQKKQKNWDSLLGSWVNQYKSSTTERVTACAADTEHIEKMVKEYALPGYLEADTIRKLYAFDFGYESILSCREQQKEKQLRGLSGERHLQRAMQYAKGETKKQIEDGIAKVTENLDHRISKAREEDAASIEIVQYNYTEHIKQADKEAQKLNKEALDRREEDYQSTVKKMQSANDIWSYEQVIGRFATFGAYKDTSERISQCHNEINRIKEEQQKEAERQIEIRRQEQARAQKTIIGVLIGAIAVCFAGVFVYMKVIKPNKIIIRQLR